MFLCSLECEFNIMKLGSSVGLLYCDLCPGVQRRISANSSVRKHKAV